MKIILDTHIFLWAVAMPERLTKRQKEIIQRRSNQIFVSSVTITEIMIKASIGKIIIEFDPVKVAQESGFDLLEYSCEDAMKLNELPMHHKDPFDRMLIAQAMERGFYIMSVDDCFKKYDCKLIR